MNIYSAILGSVENSSSHKINYLTFYDGTAMTTENKDDYIYIKKGTYLATEDGSVLTSKYDGILEKGTSYNVNNIQAVTSRDLRIRRSEFEASEFMVVDDVITSVDLEKINLDRANEIPFSTLKSSDNKKFLENFRVFEEIK